MWKCHKCGKPVYFAERKQSLGYDWHPECLRCEECGKRLNPGQHAEHKGVPYCHVPCYGALFGPQLFGHGTRVESHKSFGVTRTPRANIGGNGTIFPRHHLESKLKLYNQFFDNKSMEIRSREVNNRLILEGALRVYWGVQGVIHLKEDDDQRFVVVRKRNSCRISKTREDSTSDKENGESDSLAAPSTTSEMDGLSTDVSLSESITLDSCSINEYPISDFPTTPEDISSNTTGGNETTSHQMATDNGETSESTSALCELLSSTGTKSETLPLKLKNKDELINIESIEDKNKLYETMPFKMHISSQSSSESSSTKTISAQNSTESTNISNSGIVLPSTPTFHDSSHSSSSSPLTNTSSDNFITASLPSATNNEETTCEDNYETSDDATLKSIDFEDFKRSVHQDYVAGANSFQTSCDDSLKRNQPIDASRIHDSLKLYGDNVMSKSLNCEQALRSIDTNTINYPLSLNGAVARNKIFESVINSSKSEPLCFDYSGSDDDDSTLKPRELSTVRRSDVPQRYVLIDMNCYPEAESNSEAENSRADVPSITNSGDIAGDELTQSDHLITSCNDTGVGDIIHNGEVSEDQAFHMNEDGVVLRRPPRTGATAIKRRSGNRRSRTKLKRRCSINGHFYNRETSFFTPPYGSQMSVWITSLVTTEDVINLVLEKYKVDSLAKNFSLFVVRDNGEQKRLKNSDYPLITRVELGPHEDVARLFLVDAQKTDEISNEVAQFLNLSLPECRSILERYDQEMDREVEKIKERYAELRRRIVNRMESLKVHL